MPNVPITDNDIIKIQNQLYRVVEDKTESTSPFMFHLVNMNNENDTLKVTKQQVKRNIGRSWFKVDVSNVGKHN